MIRMTYFRFAAALTGALFLFGASSPAEAGDLASALARMTAPSVGFTGMTADIKSVSHHVHHQGHDRGVWPHDAGPAQAERHAHVGGVHYTRARAVAFAGRKVRLLPEDHRSRNTTWASSPR